MLFCRAGDDKNNTLLGGPNLLFCGAGDDTLIRYLRGQTCYSVGPATAKQHLLSLGKHKIACYFVFGDTQNSVLFCLCERRINMLVCKRYSSKELSLQATPKL